MKIFYIGPQAIPSRAANGIHMMKMAQAMADLGHQVTLACPRATDRDSGQSVFSYYGVRDNFSFSPRPRAPGRGGLMRYGLALAGQAQRGQNNIVFSRCLISAFLCAARELPVVYEIHDSPEGWDPFARLAFRILTRLPTLRRLVVISSALKEHLAEKFHVPRDLMILAPDAADPLPEASGPAPFAVKDGEFHAGYAGHLYQGRGIEVIAATAALMPDVHFHIIGGTAETVSAWKDKLSTAPNITLHGYIEPHNVADYLRHFDVLLAPYQKQVAVHGNKGDTGAWMSPLKIFEYMSSGKPMICSDLPVLREVLTHDENAILCAPDRPEEWVEAIKNLRARPQEARRLGQQAQQCFTATHTWKIRAEKILDAV